MLYEIHIRFNNHSYFCSALYQTSKNQIKVDLVDENFTELKGEIAGPPDTPYEGRTLLITLLDSCHDLCICMSVVGLYGKTEFMTQIIFHHRRQISARDQDP